MDLRCLQCEATLSLDEVLAGTLSGARGTRLLWAPCPACGRSLEMRVGDGTLEIGMTYWAGSMHFETLQTIAAPGLRLLEENGRLGVAHGEATRWVDTGGSVGR